MAGILDSKARVIDTVITVEGRRQLSQGGLDIKYVTFTDGAAFYRPDIASGSQDATQRIYFEACQLPQDNVVFQADDQGQVQSFPNTSGVSLSGGKILNYSLSTGSSGNLAQGVSGLTGNAFSDQSTAVMASALQNFQNLYLIASLDQTFDNENFGVGPGNLTFTITDDRPLGRQDQQATNINALDSVHSDPRFANFLNFKFLPPVNKLVDRSIDRTDPSATALQALGMYTPLGMSSNFGLKLEDVLRELDFYDSQGFCTTLSFDPTSNNNQLIGQFFESSASVLKKLDVIDYGTWNNSGTPAHPTVRVFFVGKTIVDEKGTDTFVHLFTLLFD